MPPPRAPASPPPSFFSGPPSAMRPAPPVLFGQLLAPYLGQHPLGLQHLGLGGRQLGARPLVLPPEQLEGADARQRDDAEDDRPLDKKVEQAGHDAEDPERAPDDEDERDDGEQELEELHF